MSTTQKTRRELRTPQMLVVVAATVIAAVLARPLITDTATHLLATGAWTVLVSVGITAWVRGGRR